jgi:hypothetical protein
MSATPGAAVVAVGDELDPEMLTSDSTSPFPKWWHGAPLDRKDTKGTVFELNGARNSWHYGFTGSTTPTSRHHRVVVYFFVEAGSMLKVVHILESSQFAIYSNRKGRTAGQAVSQLPRSRCFVNPAEGALRKKRKVSSGEDWIAILRTINGMPQNRGKPIREAIISAIQACQHEHIVTQLQGALDAYKGNAAGKSQRLALGVLEQIDTMVVESAHSAGARSSEAAVAQSGSDSNGTANLNMEDDLLGFLDGIDNSVGEFGQGVEQEGTAFDTFDACGSIDSELMASLGHLITDECISDSEESKCVQQEERLEHNVDALSTALLQAPPPREKDTGDYLQWCPRLFTDEADTDDEDGYGVADIEAGVKREAIVYRAVDEDEDEDRGRNRGEDEDEDEREDTRSEQSSEDTDYLPGADIRSAYGCPGQPANMRLTWLRVVITAVTCVCAVISLVKLQGHHSTALTPEPSPPEPDAIKDMKCLYDPRRLVREKNGRLYREKNMTLAECKVLCDTIHECSYYSWGSAKTPARLQAHLLCIGCTNTTPLEAKNAEGFLTFKKASSSPDSSPNNATFLGANAS